MKNSRGSHEQMRKETEKSAEAQGQLFEKAFGEVAKKVFTQGMNPKDAMGVSNSVLESIYAQAYRLYNTGKYIDAVHLFRMLVIMNATEPKYILGLAACFHMLKEYDNAIQTYTTCSVIDAQNPVPYYHCSDCFIQMKDYISAMISLEMTIKHAGEKPEFARIKERAQMSLESLKNQLNGQNETIEKLAE